MWRHDGATLLISGVLALSLAMALLVISGLCSLSDNEDISGYGRALFLWLALIPGVLGGLSLAGRVVLLEFADKLERMKEDRTLRSRCFYCDLGNPVGQEYCRGCGKPLEHTSTCWQ